MSSSVNVDSLESSSFSALYSEARWFQKYAAYIAVISAFVGWMLIIDWCSSDHDSQGYLGGLNFNRQLFNYHPFFMYGGLVFAFIAALVSFRVIHLPKPFVKTIHVACHSLALICIVCGLTCVIVSNNYQDKNDDGSYYPNFYSLHSFLGLTTIFFYFQNYFLGVYHFLTSLTTVPAENRKFYLPIHVCLGGIAFVLALLAVETGIMEVFVELDCKYSVTSADTSPAQHYHRLSYGCQLANGAAILTAIVGIAGLIALYRFPPEFMSSALLEKLIDNKERSDSRRTSSIQLK